MFYRGLSVSLLSLAIAACTAPHFRPEISSNALSNGGVVYFSTGSVQECTVHNVYLPLKKLEDEQGLNNAISQFLVTNRFVEKDFPESRGLLQVVTLPAGSYNFWFEQRHPSLDIDYPQSLSSFNVSNGEVKYLGEILVDGCVDFAVTVNNKYERDTAELRKYYPDVAQSQITYSLLNTNTKN